VKLDPKVRQNFNVEKALKWFKKNEGTPFGYHNYLFQTIDTMKDNYPVPNITPEFLSIGVSMIEQFYPKDIQVMFIEAMNQRFRHYFNESIICENTDCVYQTFTKLKTNFGEMMMLPERDEWIYSTGISLIDHNFVLALYKEGGIFGPITNEIQATEFGPKDLYELNIFQKEWKNKPELCKIDNLNVPYCQLLGKYIWKLPRHNTIIPYRRMNEKCEGKPPSYERKPENC
jgi:hypothetical protein